MLTPENSKKRWVKTQQFVNNNYQPIGDAHQFAPPGALRVLIHSPHGPGHRPKDASEVLEMVVRTIKLFPVGTPGLVYCITRPRPGKADSQIME